VPEREQAGAVSVVSDSDAPVDCGCGFVRAGIRTRFTGSMAATSQRRHIGSSATPTTSAIGQRPARRLARGGRAPRRGKEKWFAQNPWTTSICVTSIRHALWPSDPTPAPTQQTS
jgi:hypothetical protein